MKLIKDKIDYIAIFFAVFAIISCLLPFAIFSVTNNGFSTSTNISYISVDGIYVVASLLLVIVLLILKKKFPKVTISIFILIGLSFVLTIYELLNVNGRVASTVMTTYEGVKIGYGCYMVLLFLLLLLVTLIIDKVVLNKNNIVKPLANDNVNLQVNEKSNVASISTEVQNDNVNVVIENKDNTIDLNEENDVNKNIDMSLYGQEQVLQYDMSNDNTYFNEEALNLVPEKKEEEIELLDFEDNLREDADTSVPNIFEQYPEIIDEHVEDEIEVLEFSDDDEFMQMSKENDKISIQKENNNATVDDAFKY